MEREAIVLSIEGDFVTVQYENSQNPTENGELMDYLKPGLPLRLQDKVIIREKNGLSQIEGVLNSK